MGKNIIIKGADFSVNAAKTVLELRDITSLVLKSGDKRQYIHCPGKGLRETFQYYKSLRTSICSLDVTDFVGKRLLVRVSGIAPTATNGAYYMCFASNVSVSLPWDGTSEVKNVVTAITHIDGKAAEIGSSIYDNYELVVPEGAKYFIAKNYLEAPILVYVYD